MPPTKKNSPKASSQSARKSVPVAVKKSPTAARPPVKAVNKPVKKAAPVARKAEPARSPVKSANKQTKKSAQASVKKAAPAPVSEVRPLKKLFKAAKEAIGLGLPHKPAPAPVKTWRVYIESCAFLPVNSADGWVDQFQDGRHAAVPDGRLATPIVIPVGAKLLSISIHYTNTTSDTPLAFFLRKHADRHSPSGEIEMSFINLPNTVLAPDNYLTITDTTFPDSGVIQDRFLHYFELPTGDYGAAGKVTIRGVSLVYKF